MRIDSVTAKGFGALQAQTLVFGPGLTVVCGRNESAKSTWHAAVYAAVCGRARKRGAGSRAAQEFAARYRPWDGTTWEVEAVVTLDDGRQVHIHHDLDGQVNCAATDLTTGRDLSSEVMYEGAPDASRWLGMNRDVFSAIACVRQADILSVLGSAGGLQQHLENAATHAGTSDPSAAQALGIIEAFLKENVGKDRAKSTKPLRRAVEDVALRSAELDQARAAHEQYLELVRQAEHLRAQVAACEHRLLAARLREAELQSAELRERLTNVQRLRRLGADRRPATDPDATRTLTQVTQALTRWRNRPQAPSLTGPDAATLRAQLEALPEYPDGDQRVDPVVAQAWQTLNVARELAAQKQREKPSAPATPPQGIEAGAVRLRAWAEELDRITDVPPEQLQQAEQGLRESRAAGGQSRGLPRALIAGAVVALAGIAMVLAGTTVAGVALIIGGFVAALLGRPRSDADQRLVGHAEQHVQNLRRAQQTATAQRRAVRAEADAAGVPADAQVLRTLAAEVQRWEHDTSRWAAWERTAQAATARVEAARHSLSEALALRGISADDPESAYAEYESACQHRAQQAALAARREVVAEHLSARMAAERAAEQAVATTEAARTALSDAASAVGLDSDDVDDMQRWVTQQQTAAAALGASLDAWTEYQQNLGDFTYEQLREQAEQAHRESEQLAATVGEPSDEVPADVEAELITLRQQAALAQGRQQDRTRTLPSVAEAEERLATARGELTRLRTMETTLTQTRSYLERAQETAHRSIAPTLQKTLVRWLPQVTDGRYPQATVDPETLRVTVMTGSGKWVEASRLSMGTAEQVYLLLRVALAIHLSSPATSCPLLLDDVTVQADDARTHAVLQTLAQLAAQRQIILFAQEATVEAWARTRDDVRLILLEQVPA